MGREAGHGLQSRRRLQQRRRRRRKAGRLELHGPCSPSPDGATANKVARAAQMALRLRVPRLQAAIPAAGPRDPEMER